MSDVGHLISDGVKKSVVMKLQSRVTRDESENLRKSSGLNLRLL